MASEATSPFRRQKTAAFFVDFDQAQYGAISRLLQSVGIESFSYQAETADSIRWDSASAAVVIMNADRSAGVGFVRRFRSRKPEVPIIIVTSNSTEELAIDALRAGASEYLRYPTEETITNAVLSLLPRFDAKEPEAASIVGNSPAIQNIKDYIPKIASADSNVLITGETGTGKELVARLIHQRSRRAKHPLVCINCAAIPENLLESELFGHERGAFTGAETAAIGQLEHANGGTVFFDEIGEMSLLAQAKILRVIEDRRIQRVGSRKSVDLDVRILAATNRDLDSLAMENQFRKDLYFRLNVTRIHLPPLRDRKADIPVLVRHYMDEFNESFRASVSSMGEGVMEKLLQYAWPGNVRELKNVLEAVFVSRPMCKITFTDLPEWFRIHSSHHPQTPLSEPDRLIAALEEVNWNKSKAANKLSWSRMTLYRKMAKYHLKDRIA
jgi:DNA-binding NtrC family response regulator